MSDHGRFDDWIEPWLWNLSCCFHDYGYDCAGWCWLLRTRLLCSMPFFSSFSFSLKSLTQNCCLLHPWLLLLRPPLLLLLMMMKYLRQSKKPRQVFRGHTHPRPSKDPRRPLPRPHDDGGADSHDDAGGPCV